MYFIYFVHISGYAFWYFNISRLASPPFSIFLQRITNLCISTAFFVTRFSIDMLSLYHSWRHYSKWIIHATKFDENCSPCHRTIFFRISSAFISIVSSCLSQKCPSNLLGLGLVSSSNISEQETALIGRCGLLHL